jgi:hypothetical protein
LADVYKNTNGWRFIVDFLYLDLAAADLRRSPHWPELATMMNLP